MHRLRFYCLKAFRKFASVRLNGTYATEEPLAVVYTEYGEPSSVLHMTKLTLPEQIESNQILVKMLAAPINPADINMIQGTYPVKPPLPAVAGNEGVGSVVDVGKDVTGFVTGDWVIPGHSGFGTWRTMAVCNEEDVRKIDNNIPVVKAATISVNPCTAYRMLVDFVHLKPGDTVIQNGANSAVGQAVIQIANAMGLKTVNIIRTRPNIRPVVELLTDLGATRVLTEEETRFPEMSEMWKILKRPKLALNCTGGRSATELVRQVDNKGVMVTYGGMSKQPVTIPTSAFIFKDIRLVGFWITEWNKQHKASKDSDSMLKYLCDLIHKGDLQQPICDMVHISEYDKAVKTSLQPFTTKKQVLYMDKNSLH